jgi:iron complex transport system ATP-binding protein
VIAQALAQDTPTLLLDEPTNHLDLRHRQILMQRLFALTARGKTVVAVLHDLELAAKYADWLVLLHQGRVLRAGPPACVLDSEALSIAYDWPIRVVQESHGWRFDVLHEVNHVKASA